MEIVHNWALLHVWSQVFDLTHKVHVNTILKFEFTDDLFLLLTVKRLKHEGEGCAEM